MKLIVNADDLGLSRGVNYGIVDAHNLGIVNSASLFVNSPHTEHALSLLKSNPYLGVGIHLSLTYGKPICEDVPSLVNDSGAFKLSKQEVQKKNFNIEPIEVEREWEAQIETFYSYGITPTHVNSHHHIHNLDPLIPVIKSLAKRFKIPVREVKPGSLQGISLFSDEVRTDFYDQNITKDYFKQFCPTGDDHKVVEVMCHPGYVDHELIQNSSYVQKRVEETNILTNITLPEGIHLI